MAAAPETVTPRARIWREGSACLYRYLRPGPGPAVAPIPSPSPAPALSPHPLPLPLPPPRPPVVLVYSLINRPPVLDLLPSRSVVRSLQAAGLDVYLLDWGEPGRFEARLDLGGHLARLARAVRAARRTAGAGSVSLLGYCLGGTLAVALAALEPALVSRLALLATPIAFDPAATGTLGAWARAGGIEPERLALTPAGNVPGQTLRELLRFQDPLGQVRKLATILERAGDEAFLDAFLAQERWANGCVDFPGRLFSEWIRLFYREDRLARGTLVAGGRPVDLARLTQPILNVVSEGDRIVPPESSTPLAALVGPAGRVETLPVGGGHIGMTVGKRAPETTHRALARFLVGPDAVSVAEGEGVGVDVGVKEGAPS